MNEELGNGLYYFKIQNDDNILIVDLNNKTLQRKRLNDKNKSLKYYSNVISGPSYNSINSLLKELGFTYKVSKRRAQADDAEEMVDVGVSELKENTSGESKMKRTLSEAYIDKLDRQGQIKYKGQPIYRIVGFVDEDDAVHMYTIGLGNQYDDQINYFDPVIRSARYTTEESLVFLSSDAAATYFRKFKRDHWSEYDYKAKDFRISEYHPFNEIKYLIPVHTPLGDAYVNEQEVRKKSYEEE
jgi:hypothetical protein